MTETIITVRGEHAAAYAPDIATLAINVNYDGDERRKVFDLSNRTAEDLRKRITGMHHESRGPIVSWTSDSVRVWGDRPWNSAGKRLPVIYHSVINFTATFNDFDSLAQFIEAVAEIHGTTIGYLEWELTRENLTAVTNDVRSLAVQDAVAKATAYARAIGLSSVTPTAIADPGMLGNQPSVSGGGYGLASARGLMVGGSDTPQLTLKPEDIEVSVTVDARFVATDH